MPTTAESVELRLGLLQGQQGHKSLCHHVLPLRLDSGRKLDQRQSSKELNQGFFFFMERMIDLKVNITNGLGDTYTHTDNPSAFIPQVATSAWVEAHFKSGASSASPTGLLGPRYSGHLLLLSHLHY